MVHALIVAAGKGVRYGNADKLWERLLGKPLWWHALTRLLNHPQVSGATLVVAPGAESRFLSELTPIDTAHEAKPVQIEGVGGATRQESVRNGLNHVPPESPYIAVHDGARPLFSRALLDRLFACAFAHGAAIPVLPVVDTLKRLMPTEPPRVEQTVPRDALYRTQTPQLFRADWLRDAHQRADDAHLQHASDDASLLEWAGYPVHTVVGDPYNLKITTPEDYTMLQVIAYHSVQTRVGIGYDIHPLVEGRKLVLGGLEIEHPYGLKGHSDADVVLHAICDALLGAAALGDIGQHFPNTDPRWKDASSLELLQRVNRLVSQQGWLIAHIDAVILAEAPKLAPHMPAMRERIAQTLGIQPDQISLKATTNEGMDAVGAARAIACHAVATLQRITTEMQMSHHAG
jgi:2-C-methyl-D-erythritol 4-phosphate cytidylyltransferase/2-C-methyl-D-erythritol 2,4-cyclodiphosphate synthase